MRKSKCDYTRQTKGRTSGRKTDAEPADWDSCLDHPRRHWSGRATTQRVLTATNGGSLFPRTLRSQTQFWRMHFPTMNSMHVRTQCYASKPPHVATQPSALLMLCEGERPHSLRCLRDLPTREVKNGTGTRTAVWPQSAASSAFSSSVANSSRRRRRRRRRARLRSLSRLHIRRSSIPSKMRRRFLFNSFRMKVSPGMTSPCIALAQYRTRLCYTLPSSSRASRP
mmetsp:Transcript_50340/g.100247  ORF Transcript_50340/g.100247 Transcript_50340/m.100247 type:complete len:225 (-) Transcript_50340:1388-2062(-)